MSSRISISRSTESFSDSIERLCDAVLSADSILVGAGAGLSAATGMDYSGERFERVFSDFEAAYGFHDMYAGGFYPYETLEEMWGFWSRDIMLNRYSEIPGDVYPNLLSILDGRDYFVLTTNVDHCFQRSGFDKSRLFYTQGDYGLFQCSVPCHMETYDNEKIVREMIERQEGLRIPSDLVPMCPRCGEPMSMNLRSDSTFVEDSGWHEAAERYSDFVRTRTSGRILLLELGVGWNTPGIIKFPFWRILLTNPKATLATVALGDAVCPKEAAKRCITIDHDISEVLSILVGRLG